MSEAPDPFEPVVVWRAWVVEEQEPPRLHSFNRTVWRPYERMEAACRKSHEPPGPRRTPCPSASANHRLCPSLSLSRLSRQGVMPQRLCPRVWCARAWQQLLPGAHAIAPVRQDVDLRTGRLRPHDPADLITLSTEIAYRPEATCPRWQTFLEEIFGGNVRTGGVGSPRRGRRQTDSRELRPSAAPRNPRPHRANERKIAHMDPYIYAQDERHDAIEQVLWRHQGFVGDEPETGPGVGDALGVAYAAASTPTQRATSTRRHRRTIATMPRL